MIKNETFTPIIVKERNELINEIENKTMIIYVEGNAYEELSNEIEEQLSSRKANTLLASFVALIGTVAIPGIGWTIGGVALASILKTYGIISSKDDILEQYRLAYDKIDNKERFVLVGNNFSFQHHYISDGCIFTYDDKCPKCNNKYDKKQMFCNNCNGHMIKITNKNAIKNKI